MRKIYTTICDWFAYTQRGHCCWPPLDLALKAKRDGAPNTYGKLVLAITLAQ